MDLKNPELCLGESFIGGEWVTAKSKNRFAVIGKDQFPEQTDFFVN